MKSDADKIKLFTGRGNPALAKKIADYMDLELGKARIDLFPDGEVLVKVDEDVRGRDCFVIQPTCTPVNDNYMELFIWIDTLKRASAGRVTAVMPYFGYARQDRKDEGRTPITAKLVANLLERAGADRVVSIDMHAAQMQGFFDIPVDHLSAGPVLMKWFKSLKLQNRIFASPDVGNVKKAQKYANALGGDIVIIDKRRKSGKDTVAERIIGDVEGKNVLMVDDMITTAGTMTEAVRILRDNGAADIYLSATHAVFAPPAMERLAACKFTKIAVTDTIDLGNRADPIKDRIVVLGIAELLGEAIHRIHHNASVSALFKDDGKKDG
jgi:ribose-phosphate pyrophosphokinase